jgi:type II secretory pathway component PulF
MYPSFIVVVFIGILLMILVVVVPKISTVFKSLNVTLPLPTKILMFMSDLILKNTIPFMLGLVAIAGFIYYLVNYKRKLLLEFFYHLPVVSDLITQIDVTNFARNFSVLLMSGLPITQALELVKEVVVRKKMAVMIDESRKMVLAGKPLSLGLREVKDYMPNIVIKLVEAGEKTGTLDKSLSQISEYFDYKVSYTLKTLTALMEPLMLVMVGVCVGGMMMAIIAPIYGVIGQVGGR